jgi:hypothetical protein
MASSTDALLSKWLKDKGFLLDCSNRKPIAERKYSRWLLR